jgi:primary-amine oxidase
MYVVPNPNATNTLDEKRGYHLVPGRSPIHLSTLKPPWSLKASEFATSHLAVTREHDNEPFANSVQNTILPFKPQQDFSDFFDGE